MKKVLPYILFLVFTVAFFYKCFFLGEVIFPASMFYNMEPYKSSEIGQKFIDSNNDKRQWNALTFDSVLEFYPWRHYLGEAYKKGELPKNNLYSFNGESFFLANGQSACYYPLNFIFVIFPTYIGFTVFLILHILLLQIFMYIFLKRLKLCDSAATLGAVAFGFSGFVISWLALPTFISVITYLPLSFYFLLRTFQEKRFVFGIMTGISLGFSILAGHLQIGFFVCIGVLVFAIYLFIKSIKNKEFSVNLFLSLILCLILFVSISSLQLLPSFLMSKHSHRVSVANDENYNWVINNSIENWRYITAFVPKAFGSPCEDNYIPIGFVSGKGQHINSASDYIEYSMYVGIPCLFFACMTLLLYKKKNILFWWLFSIFFVWLAFGGIVYKIFYYIPGVSSFGSPARFICIGLFGLSVLGAYGLDFYIQNYNEKYNNKKVKTFAPLFAVGILILLFIISYCLFICGVPKEAYGVLLMSLNIHLIGFVILLVLTYICALSVKFNPYIIVLLLFVDLFLFGANFNETCKKEYVYPKLAIFDKLKDLKGTVAVINNKWSMFEAPNALLPPNMLMYYGIKEVGGYDSLFLGSYKKELEALAGENLSPVENGNMIMIKKPFKGLENYADYMVSIKELSGYKFVDKIDGVYIYEM